MRTTKEPHACHETGSLGLEYHTLSGADLRQRIFFGNDPKLGIQPKNGLEQGRCALGIDG